MGRRTEYRSRGTREERPIVFVMGDGLSECVYFDRLNELVDGVRIRTVPLKVTGWTNILAKCNGLARNGLFDMSKDILAIVTDEDGNYDVESMERFQRECDKKEYMLCMSNISFEVWLLMHYEIARKPMTEKELEERLSYHLKHPYVKSKGIPLTIPLLEDAMGNVNVGQGSPESGVECLERNPSTMVGGLVERIMEMRP